MMRRAASIVVLASIATALARCSSFDDSPANVPDASTDSPGERDGFVDAVQAGDGGLDAREGGASPCTTTHALCDDFDRPGPALDTTRWSNENGTARHELDETRAVSFPKALLVALEAQGAVYHLQKNITGTMTGFRCSAAVYLDDTGADYGTVMRVALNGGNPITSYTADLTIRPKADTRDSWWAESTPNGGYRLDYLGTIGVNAWYRFEVAGPPLTLKVNGVSLADPGVLDGGPDGGQLFGSLNVQIGIDANTGSPGWKVRFDDVVCDTR